MQAKIQTYCCVNITALKLQRNKDFQFIVELDSQGGQQNDPVVGVNSKTLLSFVGAWPSIDVFDCKRLIVISRARAAPNKLHELIVDLVPSYEGAQRAASKLIIICTFGLNLNELVKLISAFCHQQLIVAYVNTNSNFIPCLRRRLQNIL